MIEWLYNLQHFGIKLGLDNIRALLQLLDHPQRAFRTAHIAGTNGKGSVAAMTDALVRAAGLRSGLFTSPHLVRPNERIRIEGDPISDATLDAQLRKMRDLLEAAVADGSLEAHPSFFEVITATALDTFRDEKLDVGVLEVGLGGRLDATNAVNADVGAIVTIGYDHVKSLGPTLEKIAFEKAGIIKPGMPLISGVLQPEAIEVIRNRCDEVGAQWIAAAEAIEINHHANERFDLVADDRRYDDLRCSLRGPHQIDNARVAVLVFEQLMQRMERDVTVEIVRQGLANTDWPGRLQTIERDDAANLIVDGAHNPEGIHAIARHLQDNPPPSGAVLLFGATSGKSIDELLTPLAPFFDQVVVGRPPLERGVEPEEIAAVARNYFAEVETAGEVPEAFALAEAIAGQNGTVFVVGSLYLVGEVLGLLEPSDVPGPIAM